jgi:predicted phage-related endonuclease
MTLPFDTARISSNPLNRRSFIGGSDARIIMGSDEAALLRLWREKRGEAEPEDLSDNLIVQLGLVTESLNRHWFERNTGHVITDVQRWIEHPVIRWMAATLDGMVEQAGIVFEAKFMLPWSFSEDAAAQKYMPQLQHNIWVTNAKAAALSIITGGGKWVELTIPADPLYQHLLLTAEKKFWRCVESGEPPRPHPMPGRNSRTCFGGPERLTSSMRTPKLNSKTLSPRTSRKQPAMVSGPNGPNLAR